MKHSIEIMFDEEGLYHYPSCICGWISSNGGSVNTAINFGQLHIKAVAFLVVKALFAK